MPATSRDQQITAAIAEHHPEKLYKRNRGMLNMSKTQLHHFAATARTGLPKNSQGAKRDAAKRLVDARRGRKASGSAPQRGFAARRSAFKGAMGGAVAALLATFLAFAPAHATAYYVIGLPYGSNSHTGLLTTTSTLESIGLETITAANALMVPGDSCVVYYNGTPYATMPGIASPTGGLFTYYIGTSVRGRKPQISASTLTSDYVVMHNFQFINDISLGTNGKILAQCQDACRDSIIDCIFDRSLEWANAKYCYIGRSTVKGWYFNCDACKDTTIAGVPSCLRPCGRNAGNTFDTVLFPNLFATDIGTTWNGVEIVAADSTKFLFCTFTFNPGAQAIPSYFFVHKLAKGTSFRGCRFNFYPNGRSRIGFANRDSVSYLAMDVDTLIQMGEGDVSVQASASGHWNGDAVHHNVYDSCFVKLQARPALAFQAGMYQTTLTNNVLVSRDHAALFVQYLSGRNWINHNTFAGSAGKVKAGEWWDGENSGVVWDDTDPGYASWAGYTLFTNNLIYGWSRGSADRMDPFNPRAAVWWRAQGYDSLFAANYPDSGIAASHQHHLHSNYNLYSYYGTWPDDVVAKRSMATWSIGGGDIFSAPKDTLWSKHWCHTCDDSSHYGSPQFNVGGKDSTYDNFDPRIGPLSAAIDSGSAGSDIGAIAYVAPPRWRSDAPQLIMFLPGKSDSVRFHNCNYAATGTTPATDLEVHVSLVPGSATNVYTLASGSTISAVIKDTLVIANGCASAALNNVVVTYTAAANNDADLGYGATLNLNSNDVGTPAKYVRILIDRQRRERISPRRDE